jgi:hypothetical protein
MPEYVPLSRRLSGQEEVLLRGVPPHLEAPLIEWLGHNQTHLILREAALRAQVTYAPAGTHPVHRMTAILTGIRATHDPQEAFLNVVDGVLFLRSHEADGQPERFAREDKAIAKIAAESLERILRLGSSYWRVAEDHLEARVDDEVREAIERAREEAKGSASKHLGEALRACYGRTPNPGRAYSEAFKAAEAAAKPVISPKDAVTTLGRMNGELKANPALWSFAIAPGDIQPVITAMATLIDGQTDRHGGGSIPITQEAAESAVLLAATLVQWFAVGAVKRR